MKRNSIIHLLFILIISYSCSGGQNKLVYSLRNHQLSPYTLPCVVEDPSNRLHIKGRKSLLLVDANGFTIPYQRIDSTSLIFIANIKPVFAKKYTFKSCQLDLKFDTMVRCFTNRFGDVFWENERALFRMHSYKTNGNGGGIDYICKEHGKFVNKDSIQNIDFYNEGCSLGCGSIAPFSENKLVRYGNFTKMEVLDSGPILLRMRFTFPDFVFEGNDVHEERTISIVPGQYFSMVESKFIGVDSIPVAIGMPYKDEKGELVDSVAQSNRYYVSDVQSGRGYSCYAENFSNSAVGTIFTSVVMKKRQNYGKSISDGNILLLTYYKKNQPVVFYQGASNSLTGMNYKMWQSHVLNFSNHVKTPLTVLSYESE